MIRKFAVLAGASVIALSLGAGMASAQELDITKRPRPDYDAAGIRLGSFLLFPTTTLKETYNSNIYAEQNNTSDDWITRLNPSFALNSNWNNHALNFTGYVNKGFYASHNSEDYLDYGVGTDGRLDVTRAANLFGGASFDHLHEDRGSPNDVRGKDPTEYNQMLANMGGTYKPNRLGVTLEGKWKNLNYDDVNTSLGTVINNDDRDRDVYQERMRVGYDIQPGYTTFVQGSLNQRDYKNTPDDNGFIRNSNGYRIDGGMAVSLTSKVDGEVFAGYFDQNYDDPAFGNVNGLDVGGSLLWSVTRLTTVKATLARDVNETVTNGASSYVSTSMALGVDHELLRNVLVGAKASYANNDYQDISRTDHVWSVGLTAKYLINRRFFAGADTSYTSRNSDATGLDYNQFRIGANVGIQF